MKPSDIVRTLESLIPLGMPVLIKGEPGIGKTEVIEQTVSRLDYDLILTHPVVSAPVDFKGLPVVIGTKRDKADFLPIGDLRRMCEAKKPTIVFLDDVGQAPPATQAACMQLLRARRIGEHAVSKHVTFIAATNEKGQGAGVTGILEPVKSRFCTILRLECNWEDWISWYYTTGLPSVVAEFISFRPNLLNDFQKTSDIINTPSPRTVEHAARILSLPDFPEGLLHETLSGSTGAGWAAEFMGFREIRSNLPDPDLCLAKPDEVKIPSRDEPMVAFALAGACAERVTEKNMKNFMRLITRFDDDYGVVGVTLATRRDPSLKETNEFIEWISKNGHLFV